MLSLSSDSLKRTYNHRLEVVQKRLAGTHMKNKVEYGSWEAGVQEFSLQQMGVLLPDICFWPDLSLLAMVHEQLKWFVFTSWAINFSLSLTQFELISSSVRYVT